MFLSLFYGALHVFFLSLPLFFLSKTFSLSRGIKNEEAKEGQRQQHNKPSMLKKE